MFIFVVMSLSQKGTADDMKKENVHTSKTRTNIFGKLSEKLLMFTLKDKRDTDENSHMGNYFKI